MYRIFFATDVHGSDVCFRKFLAAARVYQVDALVLGGDLGGKGLLPVRRSDDRLDLVLHGKALSVPWEDHEELYERVRREGLYPYELDDDEELERLGSDPGLLDGRFRLEIVSQVQRWCEMALERLPPAVRLIITPGNDDPLEIDDVLQNAERVECPEHAVLQLGPIQLASMAEVPPTPWRTERELPDAELADRIELMLAGAAGTGPLAFNFHSPPYDCGLDMAAELDADLKPVVRGSRASTVPVGSHGVRDAILRHGPAVALHGHVHEGRGFQTIGRTVCLNPGSEYSVGTLCGALVDLDSEGRLLDYALTSG